MKEGGEGDDRQQDGWMASPISIHVHRLDGHEFEQAPELLKDREAWHAAVHGAAKQSDMTE